jgi:hypothetical protein
MMATAMDMIEPHFESASWQHLRTCSRMNVLSCLLASGLLCRIKERSKLLNLTGTIRDLRRSLREMKSWLSVLQMFLFSFLLLSIYLAYNLFFGPFPDGSIFSYSDCSTSLINLLTLSRSSSSCLRASFIQFTSSL